MQQAGSHRQIVFCVVDWNPAQGTRHLVQRLGHLRALEDLGRLLAGEVSGPTLVQGGWRETLRDIGDGG